MNNSKIKLKSPLIVPFLSLVFVVLSSAASTTFISIKMQVENFTETIIGIVQSGFYVGYLIGSLKTEHLIRRIGYIRSFVFFAAISGAVILIQGLYINAFFWTLLRIISGLSIAALYIIIESWFLSSTENNARSRILSIYMIALYSSQSIAQLLIKMFDLKELTAFIVFGILCFLSIIPVSINYSKTPETSTENITKKSYKEIYKSTPFSFWGCLISGLILSAIYSFLPIFAQLKGLSVSYIMATTIAGGFLLQWPIGFISDVFDRKKVLIVNSILLIVPSIMLFFKSTTPLLCYILCFLLGGFSFAIYPISLTNASERFDIKYIPFVLGIMSLVYGIGASVGPFLTSLFMELSPAGLFLYIFIMTLTLILLGFYFKKKHPIITPQKEKSGFTPISASVPIGSEITAKVLEQNKPSEILKPTTETPHETQKEDSPAAKEKQKENDIKELKEEPKKESNDDTNVSSDKTLQQDAQNKSSQETKKEETNDNSQNEKKE